jgi:hypothetical protein
MITARRLSLVLLIALFAFAGFAVIEGCGGGKQAEQTQTTKQEEPTMTQEPDTAGASQSMGSGSMGSESRGSGMGSESMGSGSMRADSMGHKSMAPKSGESMSPEGREEAMTLAGYVCPMHPEETSLEPGTCSVCGMALEPTKLHYVCPMHPEETSLEPGKCSACGMELVLRPVDMEKGHEGMGHE